MPTSPPGHDGPAVAHVPHASAGPARGVDPPALGSEFTRLWTAGALTSLGSATSALAVPLLVLGLSGSARTAGLVATASALAAAVTHLPAGALADRIDRRRLLITTHATRLVLVCTLAVTIATNTVTVATVLAITTASAALASAAAPAEHAAIAQLVHPAHLPRAYARNEARLTAATLAGPPAGGALYAAFRAAPFLADAIAHALAVLVLHTLRRPLQPRSDATDRTRRSARTHGVTGIDGPTTRLITTTRAGARAARGLGVDIAAGIAHVVRSPFLRAVILITAPANAALAALTFTTTVALRQNGTPAATIGVALGALGLGALVGALIAPWVIRRLGVRTLLIVTTAALLAGATAASALTGDLVMTIPLAGAYLLTPAINTALLAQFATTTPHHLQGRVLSVVYLSSGALAALAPGAAGALISACSPTAATGAAAALLCLPLLTACCSRALEPRQRR